MKIYLKCLNNSHDNIFLPDGIPVVVGRSRETQIQDKRCSRKQLELTATYSTKLINVKQLGTKSSFVGDSPIDKGKVLQLKEGQMLFIVDHDFPHQLVIEEDYDDSPRKAKDKSKKCTIDDYFAVGQAPPKKQKTEDADESSEDEAVVRRKLELLQQRSYGNKASDLKSAQSFSKVSKQTVQHQALATDQGWRQADKRLLVYESEGLQHSSKIIAFDMDGTLITTKSGKTFATDNNDWKILFPAIPTKLKQLSNEGFKLVIVTNQMGIGKGKVKEKDFKDKVEAILKALSVPMQVLAITHRGIYRKPNVGSYKWLCEHGNGSIVLEESGFVYVGDAAGRPKNWAPGKKKDFSCSDRLFAINLDVPFFTPEEYFLSHKPAKFEMPEFDPRKLPDLPLTDGGDVTSNEQEVVVLVGYPASGKTAFAKVHLIPKGYVHINRDTMKTWQKCVDACNSALNSGKSVVVDNTNPDLESRERYVACAKARGCRCRCFPLQVSIEQAMHNNRFRELSGDPHDVIPRMIIYSYRKKFIEPTSKEGFDEIVKVNFVPNFNDEDLKKMYHKFTD